MDVSGETPDVANKPRCYDINQRTRTHESVVASVYLLFTLLVRMNCMFSADNLVLAHRGVSTLADKGTASREPVHFPLWRRRSSAHSKQKHVTIQEHENRIK